MSHLTKQKAKDRAYKGWETRRKHNPNLRNIHKTSKNMYEWRRPKEVVPLEHFTDTQVEHMAPAFAATDKHLKTSQQLNAHIVGQKMGRHKGGFQYPAQQYGDAPGLVKSYHSFFHGIPKEDFGKRAHVALNTRHIEKDRAAYQAAGITTHEIGHLVGPEEWKKVGANRAREFGEAFQWLPPGLRAQKHGKKPKGSVDLQAAEVPFFWRMKGDHPASKRQTRKGLSKGVPHPWYGATGPYEDFAETYRNLVGVQLSNKEHKKNSTFHWEDTKNRSRETYMRKYHLQSTERK